MSTNNIGFNWIRQIRLSISGLANGIPDKVFIADGSMNNLRISARIQKFFGIGDPTQIIIFNLSPETRSALQRSETNFIIETCWRDGHRGGDWEEVFYGGMLNVETYRSGSEIVTVIHSISGLDALSRATLNKTYCGITVRDVMVDLCRELSSASNGKVKLDESNLVAIPRESIGEYGWSANGYIKTSIQRLAKEYGFSWSISGRDIRASKDEIIGGKVHIIKDPELIDVNPQFATNLQFDAGLSFTCQYNAAIIPHDGVRIQSSIPENRERFNRAYKINKLIHDIDSHNSQSFITRGTAFFPIGMKE